MRSPIAIAAGFAIGLAAAILSAPGPASASGLGTGMGGMSGGGNCASSSAACVSSSVSSGTGAFGNTVTITMNDGGTALSCTGHVVVNGAAVAGGTGTVTIGSRASTYSAIWFNVTPSATNYGISGTSSGQVDLNSASNLGFDIANSEKGAVTANGFTSSLEYRTSNALTPQWGSTNTSGPWWAQSAISAGAASSTTPAFRERPSTHLDVGDGIHAWETADAGIQGVINTEGVLKVGNNVGASGLKSVPVVGQVLLEDAGVATSTQSFEAGVVTLSAGTATVTFGVPFSHAPICTCADRAATAAACSTNAVQATQVLIKGGATATINWICVGPK